MILFPAIDLYGGKAVRLFKGDYAQMTEYGDDPAAIAKDFADSGATHIHIVDLEGAKSGETPNIETVKKIIAADGLFSEVGGGIRCLDTVKKYLDAGVGRVILGTAAVKDEEFLVSAVKKYGEKIAVGVDAKDGKVAIKGWTEKTELDYLSFCKKMEQIGVKTVICTDISKDGAMKGTNRQLYALLKRETGIDVIASGGVSSLDDVVALKKIGVYGAIIGKAYYVGAINLKQAIEAAK